MRFIPLIIAVLLINVKYSSCVDKTEDYYTSLLGLQNLAKSEQRILSQMLDYKEKLETRLTFITSYLKDYEESVGPVLKLSKLETKSQLIPIFKEDEDLEKVARIISAHPLLAYRLLRRFSKELSDLMLHMRNPIETDFIHLMANFAENMKIPDQSDVEGAASGLLRIQDSYDYEIFNFVNGTFRDFQTNTGLLAFDIMFVGARAIADGKFFRAIEWFDLALNRVNLRGDSSAPFDLIWRHLENAIHHHNNSQQEQGWDDDAPKFFISLSKDMKSWKLPPRPQRKERKHKLFYTQDLEDDLINFRALCRGKSFQPNSMTKKLTCWYKKDTLQTLISPLKSELHNKDPPVLQFYEIISERVIQQLIQEASPSLKRATIQAPGKPGSASDARISTSTPIYRGTHRLVEKLERVVSELTGLVTTPDFTSEALQVSSYGAIGGYYMSHFDTFYESVSNDTVGLKDEDRLAGDRIATVMFYLSDVELGGGTAFPRLGIVSKATKGSALFWPNMKKNGRRDPLTLHGGCPVVYGNKWIANKWIRSNSQMFSRPCGLTPDE